MSQEMAELIDGWRAFTRGIGCVPRPTADGCLDLHAFRQTAVSLSVDQRRGRQRRQQRPRGQRRRTLRRIRFRGVQPRARRYQQHHGRSVYGRINRATTRASVGTTGGQGTGRNPSISRNGQQFAFESAAANLIGRADTNGFVDVFVGTRTGVQVRISQSSLGVEGNSTSRNPAISADGSAVAFDSRANNLVNGDTNSRADIFHHNLSTLQTVRVSNGNSSSVINDPARAVSRR